MRNNIGALGSLGIFGWGRRCGKVSAEVGLTSARSGYWVPAGRWPIHRHDEWPWSLLDIVPSPYTIRCAETYPALQFKSGPRLVVISFILWVEIPIPSFVLVLSFLWTFIVFCKSSIPKLGFFSVDLTLEVEVQWPLDGRVFNEIIGQPQKTNSPRGALRWLRTRIRWLI